MSKADTIIYSHINKMEVFTNNFIKLNKNCPERDYIKISKEMAALHLSCFKSARQHSNQETMFYYLKDCKTHVFFDRISLAIIQVSGIEADLLTIMVKPRYQKKGVGRKLLNHVTLYLKELGVKKLFLEVAKNNYEAVSIYNFLGFVSCGTRKNYYPSSDGAVRDAEVMVCNLSTKNGKINKKKLQKLYPTG